MGSKKPMTRKPKKGAKAAVREAKAQYKEGQPKPSEEKPTA